MRYYLLEFEIITLNVIVVLSILVMVDVISDASTV